MTKAPLGEHVQHLAGIIATAAGHERFVSAV